MTAATIAKPDAKAKAPTTRKAVSKPTNPVIVEPDATAPVEAQSAEPVAAKPTTQTADAEVSKEVEKVSQTSPKKSDRYTDPVVAAEIAKRLAGARTAGFTRPVLMELTGMTASAIWRAEHSKSHPTEVDTLTAMLDRIDSGEVKPVKHVKPGRVAKNAKVVEALTAALEEKTLAGARKLITDALALINGSAK